MSINAGQLPNHILFQLVFVHRSTLCIQIDICSGCGFDDLLYSFDAFLGLEDSNIFECSQGG